MDSLTDDLGFLLSRASGVVVRATNAALADVHLRVRQYSVLTLATQTQAGVSQRDLAQTLGLDPSQVVSLVDELVAAGHVERRPGTVDRRTKMVTPTRSGRRLQAKAATHAERGRNLPLDVLSAHEQDQLRSLLSRVAAA